MMTADLFGWQRTILVVDWFWSFLGVTSVSGSDTDFSFSVSSVSFDKAFGVQN